MSRRSLLLAVFAALLVLSTVTGLVLAVMSVRGDGFGLGGRVAVLEVEGVIFDDAELLEQLDDFRRDPSVRAFVIEINSPGGVVAPSQSIYRAIRELREEDDRPVLASIGGVGASGGYYVALAADSIWVLPGSITGSIGVVMEFPNVRELLDNVGVDVEVVKSGEHKDIGSPFREMTEGDRALLDAVVQDVYDQFVDVVALERGLPREQVLAVADGRLLSGRQAIRQGLADREGSLTDAIRAAGRLADLGEDPHVVRPPDPRPTIWDVIFGRAEAGLRRLWPTSEALRGPVLKFVPAY